MPTGPTLLPPSSSMQPAETADTTPDAAVDSLCDGSEWQPVAETLDGALDGWRDATGGTLGGRHEVAYVPLPSGGPAGRLGGDALGGAGDGHGQRGEGEGAGSGEGQELGGPGCCWDAEWHIFGMGGGGGSFLEMCLSGFCYMSV